MYLFMGDEDWWELFCCKICGVMFKVIWWFVFFCKILEFEVGWCEVVEGMYFLMVVLEEVDEGVEIIVDLLFEVFELGEWNIWEFLMMVWVGVEGFWMYGECWWDLLFWFLFEVMRLLMRVLFDFDKWLMDFLCKGLFFIMWELDSILVFGVLKWGEVWFGFCVEGEKVSLGNNRGLFGNCWEWFWVFFVCIVFELIVFDGYCFVGMMDCIGWFMNWFGGFGCFVWYWKFCFRSGVDKFCVLVVKCWFEIGVGGDLWNGSLIFCRREFVVFLFCVYGVELERGFGEECDRVVMMVLCLRILDY